VASRRGTITSFSGTDLVGRIALDDGTVVRFGASAWCLDVAPEPGTVVWVADTTPHPLGLKATSVHASAEGKYTRIERAHLREELEAALFERLTAELGKTHFGWKPDDTPSVDETLHACGVDVLPLEPIFAAKKKLERDDRTLAAWPPFDPCFVGFAGDGGGNAVGFFCYPPAIAEGLPVPVVRFDHETHALTLLARDRASFLAGSKGGVDRALRSLVAGEIPEGYPASLSVERAAVQTMLAELWSREAVSALERVAALQAEWNWPAPLVARTRVQLELMRAHEQFEKRSSELRLAHWHAHPEVYQPELARIDEP